MGKRCYVTTYSQYKECVTPLLKIPGKFKMGLDIETYNQQGYEAFDPLTSCIRSIQIKVEDYSFLFDLLLINGELEGLYQLLTHERVLKIIHNAKFEYKMFRAIKNVEIQNMWCTMIAEQILFTGLIDKGFKLNQIMNRRYSIDLDKTEQKANWGEPGPLSKPKQVYALLDVEDLERLQRDQHQDLVNAGKLGPFRDEMQVIPIVGDMELQGVRLDVKRVKKERERVKAEADELLLLVQARLPLVPLTKSDATKKAMRERYPDLMKPPSSTGDFKKAYEKLGVELPTKYDKATKTNKVSLSKDTYHKVAHPAKNILIKGNNDSAEFKEVRKRSEWDQLKAAGWGPTKTGVMLLHYHKKKKYITSYFNKMAGDTKGAWLVHPRTGRVHPDIFQTSTVTHRFSMKNPPFQTIPREKMFRVCICPETGKVIVKYDYSQLQLRIASVEFGVESMLKAFRQGVDVHKITASRIFGKKLEDVEKHERQHGKNVNFGSIFGQTAYGLSGYLYKQTGLEFSKDECQVFLDAFFSAYPEYKDYHNWVMQDTKDKILSGEIQELHGIPYIYEAKARDGRSRMWAPDAIPLVQKEDWYGNDVSYTKCNDVICHPVQTGEVVGMKKAMIRVRKLLREYDSTAVLVLQVHDELVFEMDPEDENFRRDLKLIHFGMTKTMQHLYPEVPIVVEGAYGPNWGELKEIKFG